MPSLGAGGLQPLGTVGFEQAEHALCGTQPIVSLTLVECGLEIFEATDMEAVRANPRRVVFAEGEEERVLRAVQVVLDEKIATPILMISALSDVDERVRGLRAGGDDYLTKPFASDEMAARVEVLLRRNSVPMAQTRLQVADLELDLISHEARRGEQTLNLLPTEYKLLEFLMRHAGQSVTRTMLLEKVWEYHFDPQTNVIDVHISRLRSKIDQARTAQELWMLRNDAFQIISQQHDQSVAAERINALITHFDGWLEPRQLVRIK